MSNLNVKCAVVALAQDFVTITGLTPLSSMDSWGTLVNELDKVALLTSVMSEFIALDDNFFSLSVNLFFNRKF